MERNKKRRHHDEGQQCGIQFYAILIPDDHLFVYLGSLAPNIQFRRYHQRVFEVKNAIQAKPEEQENKLVFVTVSRQGEEVKIAVKDNGNGISEENQERVFEPKFTTKSSGMGLGLAIIKNIIENYNGTITFETEPNVGTEFLVSFPINNQIK